MVGERDDLLKASPEIYALYAERCLQIADSSTFDISKDGTFDVEQAVTLAPDLMILNLEAKAATDEAGYEEKLAKVGIPIVYVDLREEPFVHTPQSMQNSTRSTTPRSHASRM